MTFETSLISHCGIDPARLAKPVDKDWRGSAAHLGPHRYTPLRQSLELKTSSALLSLIAASATWARVRLGDATDTAVLAELSEAVMCSQASPLYLRSPSQEYRIMPRTDGMGLAEGCVGVMPWIFFNGNIHVPNRWPTYPPVIQAAQFIYLTRYAMPIKVDLYDKWIATAIAKLSDVARLPDPRQEPVPSGSPPEVYAAEAARAIGSPLSPLALDPHEPLEPKTNAREFAECLAGARWSSNRFLRSPDEMLAMGFEGEPYRDVR